jgi:glycosyltransferase involved in cell wall biosynthesis
MDSKKNMKKIVLFYKRFLVSGGAERLLLKEYKYFKKLSYKVTIVSYVFNKNALYNEKVDSSDIVELGDHFMLSILKLVWFLRNNRDSIILCASGYLDIYIASVISRTKYYLHIHQPLYMSFNDYNKYSIFLKKHFRKMSNSNYGAREFIKIYQNLTFKNKILINIKAFISILAFRTSEGNFVLSETAQKEKEILFNIKSHVICGAIESSLLEYIPKKVNKYDRFKYKILSVSRLDKNKRVDVTIEAFSLFIKHEPNSVLLIGGKGSELDNLQNLVNKLCIEKNVVFLGFIDENNLYDYYAMADLSVLIDWADYRITAFEALAMNTKVLMSNEADYDKSLKEANYIYISEPTKEAVCVEMINALKSEIKISKYELNQILKKYTWHKYVTNIESHFKQHIK